MSVSKYTSLSIALSECADIVESYLVLRGYKVSIESHELGFPYTPTFLCKRIKTTLLVEIIATVDERRIGSFVGFAKSAGRDTRIALGHPKELNITAEIEKRLREQGIGLFAVDDGKVVERIAPRDLALNIQLPDLSQELPLVRAALGPAYEQFDRVQWREGFGDACQALENEARKYLTKNVRRGRISFIVKGKPKVYGIQQIGKMTLGQLGHAFANVVAKNHADSVIESALKMINRDRVGVVHKKSHAVTENRLRTNVGRHMYTILAALKEIAAAP
jgi:hypothetical protein